MNKENLIDTIDDIIPKENQIHLDLPQAKLQNSPVVAQTQEDDYQTMIKELILMALPSPSHHIH